MNASFRGYWIQRVEKVVTLRYKWIVLSIYREYFKKYCMFMCMCECVWKPEVGDRTLRAGVTSVYGTLGLFVFF